MTDRFSSQRAGWLNVTLLLALAVVLASCALTRVRVEVTSEPAGASVLSFSGEKLGATPLVLEQEQLEKATEGDNVAVVLAAPGYVERELVLAPRGHQTYTVRLTRLDADYFASRLLQDFGPESNKLARALVQIQGLVLAGKSELAEKQLQEFQKSFPNIAASYVLLASIESQRGKRDQARRYLARARELDPGDPVVIRLLGGAVKADRTEKPAEVPGKEVKAP